MVKISIVQMKSSVNKDENLVYSLDLIEEAGRKNAEMICFPEFQMAFSPSSQTSNELFSISEKIEGNFIKTLCNSAKKNNISILGTMYEREPLDLNLSELLKDKNMYDKFHVYDTVVYINNKGLIKSKYRKIHLYDALNFQESKKLLSGNEIFTPVDSPLGKMGLLVCYDLRFPEL